MTCKQKTFHWNMYEDVHRYLHLLWGSLQRRQLVEVDLNVVKHRCKHLQHQPADKSGQKRKGRDKGKGVKCCLFVYLSIVGLHMVSTSTQKTMSSEQDFMHKRHFFQNNKLSDIYWDNLVHNDTFLALFFIKGLICRWCVFYILTKAQWQRTTFLMHEWEFQYVL